jgi:hypothetical protein
MRCAITEEENPDGAYWIDNTSKIDIDLRLGFGDQGTISQAADECES